jgi:siroheme synthase (precorrin-2 oxidase/ferrochelatase)
MRLFPVFLKLSGRRCLIVGCGKISEGKILGLLSTGARIRVVSPEVTPQIAAWHRQGRVHWVKRKFRKTDLARVAGEYWKGARHRSLNRPQTATKPYKRHLRGKR